MPADTAKPAQPVAATTPPASEKKAKPKQLNFYIGGNSNTMSGSTASYNSNSALGYQVGVTFKKGSFTYWQVGLMYNYSAYGFNTVATNIDTGKLNVQALDIPVTLGINFLSFAKIIGLARLLTQCPLLPLVSAIIILELARTMSIHLYFMLGGNRSGYFFSND
jgi:hypothetical protein